MRSSDRMCLSAEQRSKIAATYEKAAADQTLPSQLRTALLKKAKWFRMICHIEVAKLAAEIVLESAPKRRYLSLAERLTRARSARHVPNVAFVKKKTSIVGDRSAD